MVFDSRKSTGMPPAAAMNKAWPAMPISDSCEYVIPAQAGIHRTQADQFSMGSRLRGNDADLLSDNDMAPCELIIFPV